MTDTKQSVEWDNSEEAKMKRLLDRGEHMAVSDMMEVSPTLESVVPSYKIPLVIYHGKCADGFSAAWCFYNAQEEMQQAFDFHAGVYGEELPDVDDRIVYMVDFSYKRDVVKEMCRRAKEVWLIDHHKSAIEDCAPLLDIGSVHHQYNFFAYTDMERSGAMLAWDFLHNLYWGEAEEALTKTISRKIVAEAVRGDPEYKLPPLLLDHVQDRDLWKFKLPGTREINAALFSHEYTFENWDKLMNISNTSGQVVDRLNLWKEGAAIERKHFKDIKELLELTKRIMRIGGYEVPCASLPYTMSSDAAHIMASEWCDGLMFAACYYDTPTHRVFSLRSTERGTDVSVVAQTYNGGGHEHAAGFRVPRDHVLAMM